ncbi:MAG: hypothetical protein HY717_09225 [Planctomycetes bacterium]|nr:hypothetical protein [Planctomycetota bacterium]
MTRMRDDLVLLGRLKLAAEALQAEGELGPRLESSRLALAPLRAEDLEADLRQFFRDILKRLSAGGNLDTQAGGFIAQRLELLRKEVQRRMEESCDHACTDFDY